MFYEVSFTVFISFKLQTSFLLHHPFSISFWISISARHTSLVLFLTSTVKQIKIIALQHQFHLAFMRFQTSFFPPKCINCFFYYSANNNTVLLICCIFSLITRIKSNVPTTCSIFKLTQAQSNQGLSVEIGDCLLSVCCQHFSSKDLLSSHWASSTKLRNGIPLMRLF